MSDTDYRVYIKAARLLSRVMGPQAPGAFILIYYSLCQRDAVGVAEDYLDAIGWPCSPGNVLALKRPQTLKKRRGAKASESAGQRALRAKVPVDPSRN